MGDYNSPLSLNRWNYVEGNPINLIDLNGQSPNCPMGGEKCAQQRLFEIITEPQHNGLLALIRSFNDGELYNLWGDYAGRTTSKRLQWLLKSTKEGWKPTHFLYQFGSDCGFAEEFRDSQHYPTWGAPSEASNQVGHFLTAVDVTYNYWDIGFLIGHEQYGDTDGWNNWSYLIVTQQDFEHWYKAVEYDAQGRFSERDQELWPLLHFDLPKIDPAYVDRGRPGNSLQDLRLSVKGFRFANWIRQNPNLPASLAGYWLRVNLSTHHVH